MLPNWASPNFCTPKRLSGGKSGPVKNPDGDLFVRTIILFNFSFRILSNKQASKNKIHLSNLSYAQALF